MMIATKNKRLINHKARQARSARCKAPPNYPAVSSTGPLPTIINKNARFQVLKKAFSKTADRRKKSFGLRRTKSEITQPPGNEFTHQNEVIDAEDDAPRQR